MSLNKLTAALRRIPDFPKPGIVYIDITPLLQDSSIFATMIDLLAAEYQGSNKPDYIAAIDARGFIIGGALAYKLGCGFIPVRKKGKLPYDTIEESYSLEYGEATVEIHTDAAASGSKVLLIDDLLATGGTANAAVKLLEKLDVNIIGIHFIVELAFLNGRKALEKYNVKSLIVEN
ncbi:MAG: adenine phosphoribosyltransferase [Victivallaceae bacterium]